MKILISGGTGLIGTNLVRVLSAAGHQVSVLTRAPEKETSFPSSVSLVQWDAASTSGWLSVLEESDAVINLAGENIAGKGFFPEPWSQERRSRIINSRSRIGEVFVDAFRKANPHPDLFLQASAIGYYGSHPGNDQLAEDAPRGAGFLAEVCQTWESSTAPLEDLGVRRFVCRLGIVLDPRGGALQRLLLPFRLFIGGPLGSGEQWYSWIHTDDVASAVLHLFDRPELGGVYNFTAPNPVTNREFVRTLGRVLNRPAWIPVPGFLLRAFFGEVASVVLEGQRVIPSRLIRSGFVFQHPELRPALEDLID